ncbi:MAG TPA: hypothetical protein ENI98_03450 [Gammaproteobacteria bacterium]|nr:hypothetical protein [Gammaproteobacteria bacterium]
MKIKQIATAVSAVLLSGSAFALSPTTVPDIEVFMSGATAQDKGIAALFENICITDASGTPIDLDVFEDDSAKPGKAHTAYFCTVDNSKVVGGFADGLNKKVLFHKRSKGGSAQGVNPVIDEVAINAMNINNGNCVAPVGTEKFWRCDITEFAADGVTRTGNLNLVVSDAGVSDVNPEMFVGANTPAGNNPVDASAVGSKMVVKAAAAVVFGVPVTTGLRDALQEAQFPGNTVCTTYTKDSTGALLPALQQPRESQDCMPSLSRNQVASLISGKIKNWSAFKVVSGSVSTALTAVASTVPTSTKVTYCRRVNGSGTQAQQNAKFLNYPCTGGALPPAAAPGSPFFGPVVAENEGSGDESLCLDDFNNGSNASTKNPGLITAWALGTQSTEKNASLKFGYRFVKIDGVAPTLENAANGKYLDWVEQTFQWRVPAFNGPSGDKLVVVETIASQASRPTTIATVLNPKFVHTWGQAGYLAVSTNFAPSATGILDLTAPVIPYTHAPKGKLDDCVVPVVNNIYQNSQL